VTQSFSRFLLCAGLLGASLTVSTARAQDADAGVDAGPPAVGEIVAPPPADAPPADVSPADAPPADVPPADAPPADAEPADAPPADTAAGTGDPAASAAAAAPAAEEPPAPPKRFWRNSLFMFTPSMTAYTFRPDAGLTYDPTVSLNFRLMPRFYLADHLFIRLRQDLNVELTQSNSDALTRQPLLSDLSIDVTSPGLLSVGRFTLTAGARFTLPVSMASRFADLILGTGLVANASFSFQDEIHLSVLFDLAYTHWFRSSNTPTFFSGANSQTDGAGICPANMLRCVAGGSSSATDQVLFGPTLLWVPDGEKLNVSATWYWFPQLGGSLADATVPLAGGTPLTVGDNSATHWRNVYYFGVSVAYDILPWFNLSATYGTFTGQLRPTGEVRNPFWGPDTTLSMTAVITLDQLYDVIAGEGTDLTPEQLRRIRNGQASGPRNGRAF